MIFVSQRQRPIGSFELISYIDDKNRHIKKKLKKAVAL